MSFTRIFLGLIVTCFTMGTSLASTRSYCAAVRGNGELMPAHWPALSKAVEHNGLPQAVAGGSSAAITLFYIDAISRNPFYSNDPDTRKQQQALLLKSIMTHKEYLWAVDTKAPVIMQIIDNYKKMGENGFLGKIKLALKIAKDLPTFMEVLGEYGPLFNPAMARGLKDNFSFYKAQIAEAISVFGGFDAKTDMNLFFRNGLIDFKYLAVLVGRVADFYAGNYSSKQPKAAAAMKQFLNQCAYAASGKIWFDDSSRGKACKALFAKSLDTYYEKPTWEDEDSYLPVPTLITGEREFANKILFEKVGSGISAFPTTALVTGDAARRYDRLKKEYVERGAKNITDFSLDFDSELSYGYWGKNIELTQLHANLKRLFPNDLKSQKFEPILDGNWFEVLSTSPAEPGLANLQRIPDSSQMDSNDVIDKSYFEGWWLFKYLSLKAKTWYNEDAPEQSVIPFKKNIYSAGGWSDLHPTLVLRAHGCRETLYITRQNGESVFGQQVFIRLTGYTKKIPFWKEINQVNNRIGWTNLSDEVKNSPWNRLYNLGNKNSSFLFSVAQADITHCTNWDDTNLFSDTAGSLKGLLWDSWTAPTFVTDQRLREAYPYGTDHKDYQNDGFPGCFPRVPQNPLQLVRMN